MNTKWIVIALLSLMLTGCGRVNPAPELLDRIPLDALDGTSWELTHYDGVEVLADTEISISFDDLQLTGRAGCKGYVADYDVRGKAIKVHEIKATEFGCVVFEETLRKEQAYLSILQEVTSFEFEDNELMLITSENRNLVFVPAEN